MNRRRTDGFTLIELLTVLVIAGVLIGLTIPAVTRLMSSGGVNAASREVANTLGLARQLAITQRVYARVVFPFWKTNSRPDMWYRAYAVMTNSDNTTANWAYATKWEYLPVGTVFLQQTLSTFGLKNLPNGGGALDDSFSLNPSTTGTMPFPTPATPSAGPLAYIEFAPTGAATAVPPNSATPSTLVITEGFTTPGTGALSPTAPRTNFNGNVVLANLTTISVDALVGHIQVTR
ncbi:MAG TPA: prepilin-type N-terminal cleavage/methylation domain-containing protein [Verrucomicrobiae bacterium]|nr:prepilin-type N-terminal cleavage/methylation domain-containing protein [Verrucomicrobiae bacterium]